MVSAKHKERRDHEQSINLRRQSTLEACHCRGWRKERSPEGTPGDGRHREGRETVITGLSQEPHVS